MTASKRPRLSLSLKSLIAATLSIASALTIIGCASTPSANKKSVASPVYITNKAQFPFLAPAEIATPLDMLQRIEGSFGDKDFSFLIYVKANEDGTELRVLNDFGSEIARIAYSASGVESSGLATQAGLRVDYILADFQLGYFAASALSQSMARIGLDFIETTDGDTVIRELRDGKNLIVRIKKKATGLEFNNTLRGYRYRVTYEE